LPLLPELVPSIKPEVKINMNIPEHSVGASATASKNREYIGQLDELRAFAAILILIYHSFQLIAAHLIFGASFSVDQWLSTKNPILALIIEGHTAVGLFITLSGFVLTVGVVKTTVDYKNFVINRLLRIYPLYLVCLFAAIAVSPAIVTLEKLVFTVLPLANFPNSMSGNSPLTGMFWTVGVEFQLYLIFPFLLVIAKKRGLQGLSELLLTAIIFRVIALGLNGDGQYLGYWTVLGRIDQFLVGMIAAHIFSTSSRTSSAFSFAAAWVLAVGVIFIFHRLGGWPIKAWWKILWPTIEGLAWAGVIYTAAGFRSGLRSRLRRSIQAIGRVSYSTYLLHSSVISCVINYSVMPRLFANGHYNAFLTGIVVVLPITLLLSALTYRSVEKPFLEMRRRYRADSAEQAAP
jgi:peptidoglycan/LPS O-acetylase OafA/YrhL